MVRTYAPSRLPSQISPYYSGTLPMRVSSPVVVRRPQSGAGIFDDIGNWIKRERILSTIAAPVISFAGEAIGSAIAPGAGSVVGGAVGGYAGKAASDALYQAGYGRRPRRRAAPKRKAAPKKRAAPKRKARK